MKNLDQIDPLPVFVKLRRYCASLPASERVKKEWAKHDLREAGEDWQPYKRDGQIVPHTYINGQGKLKTEGYKPPEPPETDIPIPCVTDIANLTWSAAASVAFTRAVIGNEVFALTPHEDGSITYTLIPETAEPQTQTASQMEQGGRALCSGDKDLAANPAREVAAQFDGWIPHKPGDPMPCDPELLVDRKYRNGRTGKMSAPAAQWSWGDMGCDDFEIVNIT
jgi:hypothetical protein